ncbi:hypothetical protein [Pseudomonas sp. NCCP-436]|uniref:hypothetical protein n=1 Tax=Pseudomonas sp. NCCP-436 TaxID=2842481 RepID=UPI001DA24BF8|nr:hypothetical protein [Pseudomonas sp. NCCP-436]GIZ11646.1 hypothetical protein NCCP436_10620 [Pseudomonas sp. NCCP-436]
MLGFFSAFRLAIRARYPGFLLGSLAILITATLLAAQFSGRQSATVGLDVGLSVIRILLPLVMIFMTQELLSREFDRRYFLNSMSYPVSRERFFLNRFLTLIFLGLLLLCVMAITLAGTVAALESMQPQGTAANLGVGYLCVIAFIAMDFLVLASLAGFLAVIASTPSFVLIGVLGFTLIARSYAAVSELLTQNAYLVSNAESYRDSLGVLGYLLPNLASLDIRGLSLYGQWYFFPNDWMWLMTSAGSYAFGFIALALWAIRHKRFS